MYSFKMCFINLLQSSTSMPILEEPEKSSKPEKAEKISVITDRKSFESSERANLALSKGTESSKEPEIARKKSVDYNEPKVCDRLEAQFLGVNTIDHRKSSEKIQSVLMMNEKCQESIRPNVIVDTKSKLVEDKKEETRTSTNTSPEKVEPVLPAPQPQVTQQTQSIPEISKAPEIQKPIQGKEEKAEPKIFKDDKELPAAPVSQASQSTITEKSVIKHKSEMSEKKEEDVPKLEMPKMPPPIENTPNVFMKDFQPDVVSVLAKPPLIHAEAPLPPKADKIDKVDKIDKAEKVEEKKVVKPQETKAEVKNSESKRSKEKNSSVFSEVAKNSCSRTTETKRSGSTDYSDAKPNINTTSSSSSNSSSSSASTKKSEASKKEKAAPTHSSTGSKNYGADSSKSQHDSLTSKAQYHTALPNSVNSVNSVNQATMPLNTPKVEKSPSKSAYDLNKMPQFSSMNQLPNYHSSHPSHPQYWQIDPYYQSYNLPHLDAATQKSPNKFHLELATSIAYNHNITQGLYQSAANSLAYQQQHQYQEQQQYHQQQYHMQPQNIYNANPAAVAPTVKDKKAEKKAEKYKSKAIDEAKQLREQQLMQHQMQYDQNCKQSAQANQQQYNQKPKSQHNGKAEKMQQDNSCMVNKNLQMQQMHQQQIAKNNMTNAMMKSYSPEEMHNHQVQQQQHMEQANQAMMNSHHQQQTPPSSSADIQSMGVYTPDSTTNSVHSLHHYQCDLDVNQLELESPASIASDMASQNSVNSVNSVESIRPPSQMNQYSDCSMQQQQALSHMNIPTSSPQHQGMNAQNQGMHNQQSQQASGASRKMNQMNRNGNNTGNAGNNNARATTPKIAARTATPVMHQQVQQQQRSRTTPPVVHANQPMASPVQQHQNPQNMQNLNQQQHLHNIHLQQQMQQSYQHHQQMHPSQYLSPHGAQMGGNNTNPQGYAQAQSPNTYGAATTVIQHRSMNNHSNLSAQNSLASPHQRLGPSPASCAVSSSNNFYAQSGNVPHHQSHTPQPISTPTPSVTPNPQIPNIPQMDQCQQQLMGNASSLSKLQQLANLDMPNQACNTPPSVVLTPPPHSSHVSPAPHLVNQNRSISTPPQASAQMALQYKYFSGNPMSSGRNSRTPAPPSSHVQHMAVAPPTRVSPNVTIGMPYHALNGYQRMPGQQSSGVTSYIANPAAASFNASQIPVMNMQSQYQDPSSLRAQQNSMYSSYPYLNPLNGTMRR